MSFFRLHSLHTHGMDRSRSMWSSFLSPARRLVNKSSLLDKASTASRRFLIKVSSVLGWSRADRIIRRPCGVRVWLRTPKRVDVVLLADLTFWNNSRDVIVERSSPIVCAGIWYRMRKEWSLKTTSASCPAYHMACHHVKTNCAVLCESVVLTAEKAHET